MIKRGVALAVIVQECHDGLKNMKQLTAAQLQEVLVSLRIDAVVTRIQPRPAVTSFTLTLNDGSNPRRLIALSSDVARCLASPGIYITALPDRCMRIDVSH